MGSRRTNRATMQVYTAEGSTLWRAAAMLMWIAFMLILFVPAVALADPLEDCEQQLNKDRRIRGCTERIRQFPRDAAAYFNRGRAYLDSGDADRAIADNTRAVELDPGYAAAYFNRGLAFERKEQFERANADYSKAIEINAR